jgi:glc operon protein GlcG
MTDSPFARPHTMTAPLARVLVEAARSAIEARGFAMFVAVIDGAATPLVVERVNDAQPASYEVAVAKARAAVGFRRPTKAFEERVLANGRVNLLSLPGMVAVEGGVPLLVGGHVAGAVGVSGGTGVEDGEIAAVVVAAFEAIARKTGHI